MGRGCLLDSNLELVGSILPGRANFDEESRFGIDQLISLPLTYSPANHYGRGVARQPPQRLPHPGVAQTDSSQTKSPFCLGPR